MLKQRIITAIVLLPLAFGIIFALPIEWFALAVLLVLLLAAWEWSPLMKVCHFWGRLAYTALIGIAIAAVWWLVAFDDLWHGGRLHAVLYYVSLVGGLWWLAATLLVFNFPRSQRLWINSRIFVGVFGFLILVPTWAAALSIRSMHYDANPLFGAWTLLFVLGLVWAADIGAYFAGKRFGKRKLMPHVSPGKTLEGLYGGVALALLVMAIVAWALPVERELLLGYFAVGLITVLISVFGDLNESMFKRCAGVKDSGSILPGHGGILDRIDSLTSALPVFLIGYLWLVV
ncbi:CDP-diglyceride synthetase [Aliidiomarina halalkaliphila]|uniref:Phosphatidate cytidylyltransferase n=1 Tax=Aliidiomarina halalkaliphila TaxID=2593535 RepID=A0A552X3F7_9GAMM|nr:phosphatidate cytidylyltransferase [Aliidiomarina halalkaliphila]TRW49574.1 CDP-diglyceride synthetase [Aliidiomarina halalkaliphila]